MLRQSRSPGSNRPLGVRTTNRGGELGYSGGNVSTPWYSPPLYGSMSERMRKCHSRMLLARGCASMPGGGLEYSRRYSFRRRRVDPMLAMGLEKEEEEEAVRGIAGFGWIGRSPCVRAVKMT